MAHNRVESKFFCVVDRNEIPWERLRRGAITCSDECAKARKRTLRSHDVDRFCVVDCKPVPHERKVRGAITCSTECSLIRKKAIRSKQDDRECRYCRKPSSPAEREAFRRFRAMERKRPDILYPRDFEMWLSKGGTLQGFIDEIQLSFLEKFAIGMDEEGGPLKDSDLERIRKRYQKESRLAEIAASAEKEGK